MSIKNPFLGSFILSIVLLFVIGSANAEPIYNLAIIDSLNAPRQSEIDLHRKNRGIVQLDNQFLPKGQWIVGATLSYSTHINDNYSIAIINGINSEGYSFKLSPIVAYAFRDNMAAGMRVEYSRTNLMIDSALLSIGDEGDGIELQARDYLVLSHSYTIMATLRNCIPLGVEKRFALFAETRLEYGGERSKFAHDDPIKGTFSTGYSLGVGVVPGMVAFATNNIAIEVSVGMVGLGFSHTDQIQNQVYVGEVNSTNLSFKLNLLSVGLGVATYF